MTNDKTVTMSRELAESLLTEATNQNWSDLNQVLNAPTACTECMGGGGIGRLETCKYCKGTGKIANHSEEPLGVEPVAERQAVAEVTSVISRKSKLFEIDILNNSSLTIGDKLYTAPPELAELQATIARLESEAVYAAAGFKAAQDEIERLKGGQGEAVAIVTGSTVQWLPGAGSIKDRTELYASSPAPVAVVYPSVDEVMKLVLNYQLNVRTNVTGTTNWAANIGMHIIDKVKELNQ